MNRYHANLFSFFIVDELMYTLLSSVPSGMSVNFQEKVPIFSFITVGRNIKGVFKIECSRKKYGCITSKLLESLIKIE